MNKFLRLMLAALLLSTTLVWGQTEPKSAASQPATSPPNKLVFGLIASRGAEVTSNNWRPFIDAMSAHLKIPVEVVAKTDFKEIVDLFKQGKLDLAWLGGVGALEVVESGKGVVFVQMIGKTGASGYYSTLIVHRDSEIQSLKDILKLNNGFVFSDGDTKSTSGHLVPLYYAFVQNKVNDPATLFKEIKQGNHRVNLVRVAQKEVDIATNNTEELEIFTKEQPELRKYIRVVWTSPEIPHSPLLWRRDLPLALKRQISQFTVNYGKNNKTERKILLQANDIGGFKKSSNRQLITVADLEMFNAWRKLWNNRDLSAVDRKQQEEQLSQRGSKLELMLRATEEY